MIRVFYGDDRVRANQEIKKILGKNHEVIEGPEINSGDLPSIFYGASLFAPERQILIRDLTTNKLVYEQLPNYLNTPHNIVLLETRLDKRSLIYKELKDQIEFRDFKLPEDKNFTLVFDIYRTAKRDGKKAVAMLEQIKHNEDPIKFTGLLISQAIKDFSARQGIKEKNILKALSKLDVQMKSTKIDPWLLVESFLLSLQTI